MKLLKSKILLGVMIFAVMFVGFAVVKTATATECDLGTVTLKQGMSGTAVTCLQTKLAVTPMTGYFGTITKGKVVAFQAAHSLTADGVVGPLTKAALGLTTTTTTLPAGCTAGALFSSTTGAPCTTTTTTGPLAGGAGDMNLTDTSSDVDDQVLEGDSTKVMGFKVEAVDSDISLTNVKVVLENTDAPASSYRLSNYADSVDVYMGSTKVGSADASDFSKSGYIYSKSIALSNAIVREGINNKATFYVVVNAVSNIDSGDIATNSWTVDVDSIRFVDATGAIMSSSDLPATKTFSFTDLSTSGDAKLTISKGTGTPAEGNVEVSDTGSTSDILMLEFKLKATGSDLSFDQIKFNLDAKTADMTDMIGNLTLKAGSDEIATDPTIPAGAACVPPAVGHVCGDVTFDLDDTYTISEGDTDTFRVYAKINDVDLFTTGDTLKVSLAQSGIATEDQNGDVVTNETGSATGNIQTFLVSGAVVTYVSDSFTAETFNGGVHETDGTISMKFKVAAFGDNDVTINEDQFVAARASGVASDAAGAGVIVYTVTGAATTDANLTSSDLTADAGVFTVSAGDTATFTLSVKFDTTSGFVQLAVSDVDNTPVSNIKTAAH